MPSCAVSTSLVFYPCNSFTHTIALALTSSLCCCLWTSAFTTHETSPKQARFLRCLRPMLLFCSALHLVLNLAATVLLPEATRPLLCCTFNTGCLPSKPRLAWSRQTPCLPLPSEASCHCVPFMRYPLTRSFVRLPCGPSQWTLACAARTLWPSTHGLSSLSS